MRLLRPSAHLRQHPRQRHGCSLPPARRRRRPRQPPQQRPPPTLRRPPRGARRRRRLPLGSRRDCGPGRGRPHGACGRCNQPLRSPSARQRGGRAQWREWRPSYMRPTRTDEHSPRRQAMRAKIAAAPVSDASKRPHKTDAVHRTERPLQVATGAVLPSPRGVSKSKCPQWAVQDRTGPRWRALL